MWEDDGCMVIILTVVLVLAIVGLLLWIAGMDPMDVLFP